MDQGETIQTDYKDPHLAILKLGRLQDWKMKTHLTLVWYEIDKEYHVLLDCHLESKSETDKCNIAHNISI